MSLALRSSTLRIFAPMYRGLTLQTSRSMAVMKPMTPEEHSVSKTEFWEKNKKLGRPISPHLTIYKFQVTSVLSVTHRATGIIQSGILSVAAIAAMTLPGTFPMWLHFVQDLHIGAPLIFLAKFALAWPVTFHLFNGVRHLAWDMGHGFKIPDLYKTGYTVVGLSVLTAIMLALV